MLLSPMTVSCCNKVNFFLPRLPRWKKKMLAPQASRVFSPGKLAPTVGGLLLGGISRPSGGHETLTLVHTRS